MFEGLVGTLITVALKAFFGQLFETLFGFLDKREQDAAHEELGAQRVAAARNKEAADAERRAAVARTKVPDVGGVVADMERGVF